MRVFIHHSGELNSCTLSQFNLVFSFTVQKFPNATPSTQRNHHFGHNINERGVESIQGPFRVQPVPVRRLGHSIATRIDPRPQNCTGPHKPITKSLVSSAILVRFIRDRYRRIALFNALLTSIICRRYSPRFESSRTIKFENIRNQ